MRDSLPQRERPLTIGLVSIYDVENNAVRGIAAVLREHGFRVNEIYFKDWQNNRLNWPKPVELDNLIKVLEDTETDLVAFSLRSSPYFKVTEALSETVRQRLDLPVLWGGLHPTLEPDMCMEAADMLCLGEGETPMLALAQALGDGRDVLGLHNFWFRRDGEVIKNEIGPLLEDLDSLPFRDYESPDKYRIEGAKIQCGDPMVSDPVYQIMTSRGCPYACSYCYNSALRHRIYAGKGRYHRQRSVENVMDELHYAKRIFPGLQRIRFDDEIFPWRDEWVDAFCERYTKEIGLPFECFLQPNIVDEEILAKLRAAGLEAIYMGVQNSERVSKEVYNRQVSDATILDAGRVFKKLGLDPRYQIILDDPFSTDEDKEKLFELLMEIPRPLEIYLFSMTVYPQTDLAKNLIEQALITEDDVEGRATKTFEQYRVDLAYPRAKIDIFWVALIVLISKSFVPKFLLRWIHRRSFLRRHPKPLECFAQLCNIIKMGLVVLRMTVKGEMTATLLRRWANIRSLITQ